MNRVEQSTQVQSYDSGALTYKKVQARDFWHFWLVPCEHCPPGCGTLHRVLQRRKKEKDG